MTTPSKKIVIGIPTYRRPMGLKRLLKSIADQQAPFTPHVLVADNEGEGGAGLRVVDEVRTNGFPFPLSGIPVPERGISQVRNALMTAAFKGMSADALAMVDDDMRVDPHWIDTLVSVMEHTSAQVVGGQVLAEFEEKEPYWAKGLSIYHRNQLYPAGVIDLITGTGSVILSQSCHASHPDEHFDHDFSLSGGEDKEFFVRLKKKGVRFAYAPDAVSYELVGTSRATRRWAIQRAYRIGSGDARIFRIHSRSLRVWTAEITKLLAALVISTPLIFMMIPFPRKHMKFCLTFARQVGKINGLFGQPKKFYLTVHGS